MVGLDCASHSSARCRIAPVRELNFRLRQAIKKDVATLAGHGSLSYLSFLRTKILEFDAPTAGQSVNGFRLNCAVRVWSFAGPEDRRQPVSERRLLARRLERHRSSQECTEVSISTRQYAHIGDAGRQLQV